WAATLLGMTLLGITLSMGGDAAHVFAIGRRGAIFPFARPAGEGVVGFGSRRAGFFSHGPVLAEMRMSRETSANHVPVGERRRIGQVFDDRLKNIRGTSAHRGLPVWCVESAT